MSEPIRARVNGSPILNKDFVNAVQGYAMELQRKTKEHLDADELAKVEALALEKLLARELLYQEALARGLVATAEAVGEEVRRLMANFPSDEEFFGTLAKAGIDQADYQRMIRQDLTVNLLTTKETETLPEPDEEAIAAFYREHAEQMREPARARACHILLKIRDGNKEETRRALEVLRERSRSEDFAALAQEASDCPSAARGGDLGYFRRGEMVQAFADEAFSQPVGEVGEVVETPFGLHLIKVLERKEARTLDLAEATPKIRRYLLEQQAARHLEQVVGELRQRATIEYA
ncbi:MAG: peptidylprolyl isomerase [Bacteroidales bacterium]|nr:peptidylprolyl isomerase [Bacteroidales bacterium]